MVRHIDYLSGIDAVRYVQNDHAVNQTIGCELFVSVKKRKFGISA